MKRLLKILFLNLTVLIIAAAIWLPCFHFIFKPDYSDFRSDTAIAPNARMLAARHLAIWTNVELRTAELAAMQEHNPEWDFMSRTFFVLALANMAIQDPAYKDQACTIIDLIIDHTAAIEKEKGFHHFLLSYSHGNWKVDPERSIFIDGEIALMIGARRLVEEKDAYKPLFAQRIAALTIQMSQSPVLAAESYPNECWLFCNTVSLAALRMSDVLDKTDNSAFIAEWLSHAKKKLLDKKTGILISTYDVDGEPISCGFTAEGSTIWMASHMLQIVDPVFAADQYRRAKDELGRSLLGFGYSREWPECYTVYRSYLPFWLRTKKRNLQFVFEDVDSGPVLPWCGASASASGQAIMGAAAFDDHDYFIQLITSLNLMGFPEKKNGQMWYCASNPVGDAVMLYAMVEGPLWDTINTKGNSNNTVK